MRYVGNYVIFTEFNTTKITSKDNYVALYRNASKVMTFDGTIDQAVEYVKKYLGG